MNTTPAPPDTLFQAAAQALEHQNLDVSVEGQALLVSRGRGRLKRQASLTLSTLTSYLDDHPAAGQRRAAAGFANGVRAVLNEPARSDAAQWDFVKCAGRLTPSLEHRSFAIGATEAADEEPWLQPFSDELCVAYHIELDRGTRLVTAPQFERWGVTAERITAASRSLLFYKTAQSAYHGQFEPHPPSGGMRYTMGDGYDAARALILNDLDYQRARRGIVFTMPHQDLLLMRDLTDDGEALDTFMRAASDAYHAASYPLTRRLYTYEDARHVRPFNPSSEP